MVGDAGDHPIHVRRVADGEAVAAGQDDADEPALVGRMLDTVGRIEMRPRLAAEARVIAEAALVDLEPALSALRPVHLGRAVHGQTQDTVVIVKAGADARRGDPRILLGPDIPVRPLSVGLVERREAEMHHHRDVAAIDIFQMGRRRGVQTLGGVQMDQDVGLRLVEWRRFELLQHGA